MGLGWWGVEGGGYGMVEQHGLRDEERGMRKGMEIRERLLSHV